MRSLILFCLILATSRSFVDPAPANSVPHQDAQPDSSVQELENLKHSLGKTVAMMKSQSESYSNINGDVNSQSSSSRELKENGKLVSRLSSQVYTDSKGPGGKPSSKVRTDIEIPSLGVHKSYVQDVLPQGFETLTNNGNRRTLNPTVVDKESLSNVQYSPLDMAEYVFWTGDEKGVSMAIEDFLQEGLMSREEAISFLQEIKYNLEYLKAHYTQLGIGAREQPKEEKQQLPAKPDKQELKNDLNEVSKRMALETTARPDGEEEYDELLERLRVVDFLYTEYSLEEVIYQLAKVMFTQGLTRGSEEAQKALQKFTNFLETEAEQGHISRALEKKVLDVLIAALSDTLTEHPELLTSSKDGVAPLHHPYARQVLDVGDKGSAYKTDVERLVQERLKGFSPISGKALSHK